MIQEPDDINLEKGETELDRDLDLGIKYNLLGGLEKTIYLKGRTIIIKKPYFFSPTSITISTGYVLLTHNLSRRGKITSISYDREDETLHITMRSRVYGTSSFLELDPTTGFIRKFIV